MVVCCRSPVCGVQVGFPRKSLLWWHLEKFVRFFVRVVNKASPSASLVWFPWICPLVVVLSAPCVCSFPALFRHLPLSLPSCCLVLYTPSLQILRWMSRFRVRAFLPTPLSRLPCAGRFVFGRLFCVGRAVLRPALSFGHFYIFAAMLSRDFHGACVWIRLLSSRRLS